MEIQKFPEGKKVFKISAYYAKNIVGALDREVYNNIAALRKTVTSLPKEERTADKHYRSMRLSNYQTKVLKLNDDPYPTYEALTDHAFSSFNSENCNTNNGIYTTQVKKATSYQRTEEYRMLGNLPNRVGLQFYVRGDKLTVFNMPYEGELVKSDRYKEVNNLITTRVKELKAKIELTCIVAGGYLDIPKNIKSTNWDTKNVSPEQFAVHFMKYLEGTSDLTDELLIARHMGILDSELDRISYTYVYKTTNKKPKFPTGIRTRIYYMAGAYKVPDNYQDWFDK
jgi:hypothetical protein